MLKNNVTFLYIRNSTKSYAKSVLTALVLYAI